MTKKIIINIIRNETIYRYKQIVNLETTKPYTEQNKQKTLVIQEY